MVNRRSRPRLKGCFLRAAWTWAPGGGGGRGIVTCRLAVA